MPSRLLATAPTRRLPSALRIPSALSVLLAVVAGGAAAQTNGSILGQVTSAAGEPLRGVQVSVTSPALRAVTGTDGRFVLGAVPAGERTVHVEMLGYRAVTVTGVRVSSGRATELKLQLEPAPVSLKGIEVEAERVRLIEPEVSTTHEVVTGRELRELPLDRIEDALELATGVSQGHFRGGRIGQETYVVDGLAVKNVLEASSKGAALEFSPTSLDEMDVITGGLSAAYGSAISGAVSYATRRGSRERWESNAGLRSDGFQPKGSGFTSLSLTTGGPLRMLGDGTTVFGDLLLQGMADADPHARGATCLSSTDLPTEVASRLQLLRGGAGASLYCPYAPSTLPHDAGDRVIGFLRLDRPLGGGLSLTATALGNRLQRQLYTPELKYSTGSQLGQRSYGSLGTLTLDWTRNRGELTQHALLRGGVMRLDRYLGALDPWTMGDRPTFANFGFGGFRFLGEDFARSSPEAQLQAGTGVPGYVPEGGAIGSPYGPAGQGIFFTTGTPQLANWTRSEQVSADVLGEVYTATGVVARAGASGKLFRIQSYERTAAANPGSAFNYALFFPRTASGFGEVQWGTSDELHVQIGVRLDAFKPGLDFRFDRANFLAPSLQTDWKLALMPRFGASMPLPGSRGRTVLRANFTRLAEPPDFQYFLDTTVGDSLRTSIRRQGNANLSFEHGSAYEVGVTQLLTPALSAAVTVFRKDLENLVSGDVRFGSSTDPTFSLADYGTVTGLEVAVRGRWPGWTLRAGYSLQKAVGVSSGALGDTVISVSDSRVTYPLSFDQRHSIDASVLAGRAAGGKGRWGAALAATARSGYPLDRRLSVSGARSDLPAYLPWTSDLTGRASYELGSLPACGCRWRVTVDGRNLLGLHNVMALRRDSGLLGPAADALAAVEGGVAVPNAPIPLESPRYSALIDLNKDGNITPEEFRAARFAAALDRFDPSLYYGEPLQLRAGVEVTF